MAKKSKDNETTIENTIETTTLPTISNDDEIVKENTELKDRLAKLEAMILGLAKAETKSTPAQVEPTYVDEIIPETPMGKIIRVMSLFNGGLNLKTSNDGSAIVYRFEGVGEMLPIMYSDLVRIISNQRKYFLNGSCMILDQNVVKAHSLEDIHKKMVDGNTIKNILTFDVDKIKQIFTGVIPGVQQTIVEVVVGTINKNEYYDKNKVDAISTIYGTDIFEIARRTK